MLTAVPYGATQKDTAEYMLGDVQVTVVFIESSESSANTETWTPGKIAEFKETIQDGLEWWEQTALKYAPGTYLDFHINFAQADTPFIVNYEPISGTSYQTEQFVNAFLASKGHTAGSSDDRIYAFNHAQRVANNTDWAFTIFVVNAENDTDHSFDTSLGGFAQSFAYPGGRYFVTLSTRPAEIIAHETGHIFWAFDEYKTGGDPHTDKHGYYNVQNLNGANGAPTGFVQQPSIMGSGFIQSNSFSNKTLPIATRAHIGWQDSDGDGIFDVLDVAHSLTGTGWADPQTGNYRFVGKSQVRTLPNLNSVGNKNDITINRIHLAEYSLDNGQTWSTAGTYDAFSAELDLTIPLAGQAQIQIRTRDTRTGVMSEVFSAATDQPASIAPSGIHGFVYRDLNKDGDWDASEGALAGRTVRLVDSNGVPLAGPAVLEPDNYAQEAQISSVISQATLSITGSSPSGNVYAVTATYGSRTSRMLGGADATSTQWHTNKRLRIQLNAPTRQLSIDAVGTSTTSTSYGRIEIYSASNILLGRYTTGALALGQVETMTLSSSTDIAYAVVWGHGGTFIGLDHFVVGAAATTTTNAQGAYSFAYLPAGNYRVQAVPETGFVATEPSTGIQSVTLTGSQSFMDVVFGQSVVGSGWHNYAHPVDVDDDGTIAPIDALTVINYLNSYGAGELPSLPSSGSPKYVDIDNDGVLTPSDALAVIIYLNTHGSGSVAGEAATTPSTASYEPPVGSSQPGEPAQAEAAASDAEQDTAISEVLAASSHDAALLELVGSSTADVVNHIAQQPLPLAFRGEAPANVGFAHFANVFDDQMVWRPGATTRVAKRVPADAFTLLTSLLTNEEAGKGKARR